MNSKTFEWNGATFTVRAQSALEANVFYSILGRYAQTILKDYGATIETVAPSLDALITRFIQLMQTTTILGDVPFPKSIHGVSTTAHFRAWETTVTEHDELFSLWWDAYQEVNKKSVDPN